MYVGILGAIWGVADHNVFKAQVPSSAFHFYMANWPNPDGTTGVNGDGSFAAPTQFRKPRSSFSLRIITQEALTEWNSRGRTTLAEVDGFCGTIIATEMQVQSHGTEDGRWRGGRAREIYNNDFHIATHTLAVVGGMRSGVTVFHDNTFDGREPGSFDVSATSYR